MLSLHFNKFTQFVISFLAVIAVGCSESQNTQSDQETTRNTAQVEPVFEAKKKIILFFGNSLTAGYGVDANESFPSLIQARIDSLALPYMVVNAGVSGETTATGLSRIDWVLDKQRVDIFILELGANDGLRGLPPEQTQANLEAMIEKVRMAYPNAKIILAGMMVPPSMGQDYSARYNPIYPAIAKDMDVALIPFLLEDVGGIDSLNQGDGIHPNPAGARIVAENVWEVLQGILLD